MMNGIPIKKLGGFVGLQGVSAIVPLLVLPAINSIVGREGWVALSLGYAVGAAAAIGCALAWPMLGPHRVANADEYGRQAAYFESLVTRTLSFVCCGAAAGIVAGLLAGVDHRWLAVSMAVALTSWGLTPSWYFVGTGHTSLVARYETIPRILASAASIPLVSWTHQPFFYPLLVLATSLVTTAAASHYLLPGPMRGYSMPDGATARLRQHLSLTGAALIGAGYTSLVLPLARIPHPGVQALSDVAASIRIRNMAQMGTAAVTTGLQGWVTPPSARERRARRRKALVLTTGIGVISAIGLFVALPVASRWLFSDVASISWSLSAATSAACVPYAVGSTLSFHVLAPEGRTREISRSRIVGSLVGVPAIVVATATWGACGAMIATALAECLVVAWQIGAAWPYLVGHPRRRPSRG